MNERSPSYRALTSSEENRNAAAELARAAHMHLALFTPDLETAVYDNQDFIDAIQRLALRSRYSKIRILVTDPTSAIKNGHRLIELGRHLSSFIEFRRPSEQHANRTDTFMVIDETGLMYRPLAERYEGYFDPDNAFEARVHLRDFDIIWEQSEAEPEFRRLGL
ncbi:MAG: hypothetical protein KGL13_09020 [Gammaproteobacteria bacterium]|nr:hypothetical protein [Gammaproteobacteria bacterium]MDE2346595.1 hypothetical protein [Gammaproteobacteria bacterium]